jgi:hypothetical protein
MGVISAYIYAITVNRNPIISFTDSFICNVEWDDVTSLFVHICENYYIHNLVGIFFYQC